MNNSMKTGLTLATFAYVTWGLSPIFWKFLDLVPTPEILAWRVASSSCIAWMIIVSRRRLAPKKTFTPRVISLFLSATALITANWAIYLWAVASGRIIEAGLGYYILPLVSVVLGMFFFSEKLGRVRFAAVILALAGLIVMTLATGRLPWISIVLAISFGFYGSVIKKLPAAFDSIEILAWVLVPIWPVAGIYLGILGIRGDWFFVGNGAANTTLLLLSGVMTLLPLWLFGMGARRLPLGIIGFLQYIAPTLMLIIGTLLYGEIVSMSKGIAFFLVLLALVFYSSTLRDT